MRHQRNEEFLNLRNVFSFLHCFRFTFASFLSIFNLRSASLLLSRTFFVVSLRLSRIVIDVAEVAQRDAVSARESSPAASDRKRRAICRWNINQAADKKSAAGAGPLFSPLVRERRDKTEKQEAYGERLRLSREMMN